MPLAGSSTTWGYSKASSTPPMPSAFICWSSRRISGFCTAMPNHHQRTMGFALSGGFAKACFSCARDVCAHEFEDNAANRSATISRKDDVRRQTFGAAASVEFIVTCGWNNPNSISFESEFQRGNLCLDTAACRPPAKIPWYDHIQPASARFSADRRPWPGCCRSPYRLSYERFRTRSLRIVDGNLRCSQVWRYRRWQDGRY